MRALLWLVLLHVAVPAAWAQPASLEKPDAGDVRLYNPYHRHKNGPPLTNVFAKANARWILAKLREPRSSPWARMPAMSFSEEDAAAVMAYLSSIADQDVPSVGWPDWVFKPEDEMTDEEYDAMFDLVDEGEAVWGQARCTICHVVNGPTGDPVGGFVDLRVGGVDLRNAGTALKRDWLYQWLRDPKAHFPETLMPRYRFSDRQIRGLVEFILRDSAFVTGESQVRALEVSTDPEEIQEGRQVIELSRCVVCHTIKGIPEVLPPTDEAPFVPAEGFETLAYDVRCLTCHSIGGRGGTYAPDLTNAGSRLRAGWIREFVTRPDFVRPLSQQMPRFNLSDDEAEAIARYLKQARLGPVTTDTPVSDRFTPEDVAEGSRLFRARGCLACHSIAGVRGGSLGPDLTAVADRLEPEHMYRHLLAPHEVNPYSVEPDYRLDHVEARALTAFLARQSRSGGSPTRVPSGTVPSPGTPASFVIERSEDQQINRRHQARSAVLSSPARRYAHYCASCHGERGTGDGRFWVTELTPGPVDLTDSNLMSQFTDASLVRVISEGSASIGRSSFCPPWSQTIPSADLVELARYVKSFSTPEVSSSAPEVPVEQDRLPVAEEPFPLLPLGVVVGEALYLLRIARRRRRQTVTG